MRHTQAHEIPVQIRRMAAAVHEAGHAIAAIVMRRNLKRSMLRPPNGLSGQTEFEDTPDVILDLNVEAHRHIVEDAIVEAPRVFRRRFHLSHATISRLSVAA